MALQLYEHCTLLLSEERPYEVLAVRYAADGDYCDGPDRQHHATEPDTERVRSAIRDRYHWAVTLAPWKLTARGWVASVTSCLPAKREG